MADFDKVDKVIVAAVKACGTECITGNVLQSTLLDINDASRSASAESVARDTTLQQGIDASKGKIAAVTGKVAAVEVRVDALEPKVSQNEKDIVAVKENGVAVDAEIKALKARDAQQDGRIGDVANRLPAFTQKNEEQDAELSALKLSGARQDADILKLQSDADAISPKVAALEGKVQKNERAVADVKGDVAVNHTKVVALESEQKAQGVRIAKNDADILTLQASKANIAYVDEKTTDVINNYTYNDIALGVGYKDGRSEEAIRIDLVEIPTASTWVIVFPATPSGINVYRTRGNGADRIVGTCTQFANADEKDRTFSFISLKVLVLNTTNWTFYLKGYEEALATDEVYAFGAREHSKTICPFGILVPTLFYNFISNGPKGGYMRSQLILAGATPNDDGTWTLNGISGISQEMIERMYALTGDYSPVGGSGLSGYFAYMNIPTNFIKLNNGLNGSYANKATPINATRLAWISQMGKIVLCGKIDDTLYGFPVSAVDYMFFNCKKLKEVAGRIIFTDEVKTTAGMFTGCVLLEKFEIYNLNANILLKDCPLLDISDDVEKGTLAYMVHNAAGKAPITITLAKALEGKTPPSILDEAQIKQITIAFA